MKQSLKYTPMSKDEAKAEILNVLKPGMTVFTVLRHVSRSGMFRRISPVVLHEGDIEHLDAWVADLLGRGRGAACGGDGVPVHGCGMDMGFELVYNLSATLFPDGFECIGGLCPSNDHSNGDRNYTPHTHESGGYALRQRWI